jgi:isopentenyldiphosphate isomerase
MKHKKHYKRKNGHKRRRRSHSTSTESESTESSAERSLRRDLEKELGIKRDKYKPREYVPDESWKQEAKEKPWGHQNVWPIWQPPAKTDKEVSKHYRDAARAIAAI